MAPTARAELVRLGAELEVNAYTTSSQNTPAVAASGSGSVIVWTSGGSAGSDNSSASIQARRYQANGVPVGAEFQVNTYTTDLQRDPSIGMNGAGGFVVVWASYGSQASDSDGPSIQARRFDATGSPLGSQFQVNAYTTGAQYRDNVATDALGNFVVVWTSFGSAGSDTMYASVQARRFDDSGAPLGGEFQVNTYTTGFQWHPAVAMDAAGNFVVVWASDGSSGSDTSASSIQAQRYDANGTPLGGEFQVNTVTAYDQQYPAVARDASGNFVVAWDDYGSEQGSVHAQRFDAAGVPLGGEFQVDTFTTNNQADPSIAVDGAGNFLVAWTSTGGGVAGDSFFSIEGRRYDADGLPTGAEFQINTATANLQDAAAVATDTAGNFVVAWNSNDQSGLDTDTFAIKAQRYATGRPVLGKKMLVKDPTGAEAQRAVVALAKESATDIGPTILGDPTTAGATLRLVTNGMTGSDQSYALDASGWSTLGSVGFRYSGPTGGDGDPVKKVLLKRTPGGTAFVKVLLKGSTGTQSLDVVPPNLGDDGGFVLTIPGGGTYCATYGGPAGGTEAQDNAQLWKIINAIAKGCPVP